jgi:hypothetical protein
MRLVAVRFGVSAEGCSPLGNRFSDIGTAEISKSAAQQHCWKQLVAL